MNNQIFIAGYYDTNHDRVVIYSGSPLDLEVVRLFVDAYEVIEAQFLKHPIILIFDEGSRWTEIGTSTWGSIKIISPDELKALNLDNTNMFCVNREFLNVLSVECEQNDVIDVVGSITLDIISDIFDKNTCFICVVSHPEIELIDPEIEAPIVPEIE